MEDLNLFTLHCTLVKNAYAFNYKMQKEVFFSHDFKKIMVFLTRFPPFVRSCFVVDKRVL